MGKTTKNKEKTCRDCKKPILKGVFCTNCLQARFNKLKQKSANRRLNKWLSSQSYGISKVKEVSEDRYWSSSHKNCFRCTFGPGESEDHINKKFELWKKYIREGNVVFCELILKNGLGRPDLIIVKPDGKILIVEVVCRENEESILKKKVKYPFNTIFIKT